MTVFGAPRPGAAGLLDLLVETTCESLGVDDAGVHLLQSGTHDVPAAAPVRFYAAAPLRGPDGSVVATLCAVAHHARRLTAAERRTLLVLGLAAARVLDLGAAKAG